MRVEGFSDLIMQPRPAEPLTFFRFQTKIVSFSGLGFRVVGILHFFHDVNLENGCYGGGAATTVSTFPGDRGNLSCHLQSKHMFKLFRLVPDLK